MKLFLCDCSANSYLFFESVVCTVCSRLVGYCPDRNVLAAFSPVESSAASPSSEESDDQEHDKQWTSTQLSGRYRQCQNYVQHQVCNWMVPAEDPNPLCLSCRLTETIPDLSKAENIEYWRKLEIAKRHSLYDVLMLGLPVVSKKEDPEGGLSYRFLADRDPDSEFTEPLAGQQPVMTGHDDGVITVNLAEADDVARTRTRVQLGETYRTLLGHFRHEIGHYYWSRLVANQAEFLDRFRECFGDERADYAEAQARHYDPETPAQNWSENYISAYAAMHPWEDWAECWAHYLHMLDTLETAQSYALQLQGKPVPASALNPPTAAGRDLDQLLSDWVQLALALNSLNRSMGKSDPYPFVLTGPVKDKLRLVDHIVASAGENARPEPSKATASSGTVLAHQMQ